ncbi:adenylyl-sulfate kinase [Aquirufa aurantiipilula]|uniref:Adenylyl-sulfate kinase n=1 Tax=Aquirufa aurantiipilula TaxID=2696561 RepID=A0ABT6BPG9_9BACT|nr:adenylyl-sulfate kinase [Aquirufa aurantiipilula]MDF5691018.1 adenylyl-sulfate kinase [Aquirufa aurantiipilula]
MNKCIWLLGLSGAGKSSISLELSKLINSQGLKCKVLDGDTLRKGINENLGFSNEDRFENVRRTAEIAKLFLDEGYWVIVAMITPMEAMRQKSREILKDRYLEIFIDTPLQICMERDPKGLYQKVKNNEIQHFTGIDSPFEKPNYAHLTIETTHETIMESAEKIKMFVNSN